MRQEDKYLIFKEYGESYIYFNTVNFSVNATVLDLINSFNTMQDLVDSFSTWEDLTNYRV